MLMTARTPMARNARTTPMRVPETHSRLYRKTAGREAKLCYMGHATMENRHGLAVAGMVTHANGTAERRASETMLKAKSKAAGHRITAGEDKAYDTADHVANLRAINVTPEPHEDILYRFLPEGLACEFAGHRSRMSPQVQTQILAVEATERSRTWRKPCTWPHMVPGCPVNPCLSSVFCGVCMSAG